MRSCWPGDRESNLASTAECDWGKACMWCSVAPEREGHSRDCGEIECIGDYARNNDACLGSRPLEGRRQRVATISEFRQASATKQDRGSKHMVSLILLLKKRFLPALVLNHLLTTLLVPDSLAL